MQLTEFNRCFSVAFNTALFFLSLSKSGTYNNRKLRMSIKLFPEAINKGQYMLFMFSFFLSCFFMGPLRNFSCVNIVRRWPGGLPWIQLRSLRDSDWLCSTAPAAATEVDSPVKARRNKGAKESLTSCSAADYLHLSVSNGELPYCTLISSDCVLKASLHCWSDVWVQTWKLFEHIRQWWKAWSSWSFLMYKWTKEEGSSSIWLK